MSVHRTFTFAALFWFASPALLAQDASKPGPEEQANAAIYGRVDRLRRAGANLRIDGNGRDWADFPQFADPRGDTEGDDRRDIVGAAIAPTETDLWIMLRTAAAPSTGNWTYCFCVEMWGERGPDFRIEVESLDRPPQLRRSGPDGNLGEPMRLARSRVAIRHAVELKVPLRDLAAALPAEAAPLVEGPKARPWVRVATETRDGRGNTVDRGPSVASFRLLRTPFALDSPLPKRPCEPLAISMPLAGQWFISQGPMGAFSHRDVWAYDLTVLDPTGTAFRDLRGKENADYYAWKRPVLSPIEGRVARARSNAEDLPPQRKPDAAAPANELYLWSRQGFGVSLVHLREASLSVNAGERVKPGQPLAEVGNSGASDVPHLHLAVWAGARGESTAPVAFRYVRVGLNPVALDPWARDLPLWEPRRGYFVQLLREQVQP